MVCGYGDKLSASSSASSLMLFQLSPAHLQAFSLYLQVQRDHRQRTDPFHVTDAQWINWREIAGLQYPFTEGRGTAGGSTPVYFIYNSWWKTLSLYSQSSKGQTLQYLQTDESLATASCFFRSTLTVLILFCIKNWRTAQMVGGPEPKGIPHIWSLSLPALWWSLRTLLSMVGLHTGRYLSFPEHWTVHHTALSNSSWGCRVRETWEENPWVSRNPLAQARKKQIYWLGRQCRIWESWVHIQSLLPAL